MFWELTELLCHPQKSFTFSHQCPAPPGWCENVQMRCGAALTPSFVTGLTQLMQKGSNWNLLSTVSRACQQQSGEGCSWLFGARLQRTGRL